MSRRAGPPHGAPPAARSVRELPALSDSAWAALVLSLSEEGGYFDTDNLISNERSYLHVVGPLRRMRGGAYLGVGPDQSFSYLAAARLLGARPAESAVFEDALAGVEAGRAGAFGYVIGVDRIGQSKELFQHGATVVVSDLAQLLEGA